MQLADMFSEVKPLRTREGAGKRLARFFGPDWQNDRQRTFLIMEKGEGFVPVFFPTADQVQEGINGSIHGICMFRR